MRQNPEFLLRSVADSLVLVPVGHAAERFPGMVSVNTTSAFLWEQLAQEQTVETLIRALLEKYEVTEEKAREDVESFLKNLTAVGAVV